LPLSLYRNNYKVKNFFQFILKRSLRVDPPYWFSIILLFTIGFYPLSLIKFDTLFYHITYLLPFIKGQEWFTSVYWTLSIEFQFYLIIGLIFPLLMKVPKYFLVLLLVAISFYCLRYTVSGFIISYVYQFVFGFIAFLGYSQLIKLKPLLVCLIVYTILICFFKSITSGVLPFITVLIILFVRAPESKNIGTFLGNISYSIYLIHIPIMAFTKHFVAGYKISPIVLSCLLIVVIIPAAYLMHQFVEAPAIKLSKRIRYKSEIG
jgi:peptidoglycan/LPS O-acetylase OafA/YrhL